MLESLKPINLKDRTVRYRGDGTTNSPLLAEGGFDIDDLGCLIWELKQEELKKGGSVFVEFNEAVFKITRYNTDQSPFDIQFRYFRNGGQHLSKNDINLIPMYEISINNGLCETSKTSPVR